MICLSDGYVGRGKRQANAFVIRITISRNKAWIDVIYYVMVRYMDSIAITNEHEREEPLAKEYFDYKCYRYIC